MKKKQTPILKKKEHTPTGEDSTFEKICKLFFLSGFILSLKSCFDYSPFDANVSTTNLNANNIQAIAEKDTTSTDTVKFAVIADPHSDYDDLKAAIASINKQANLSFVICCGDLTEWGSAKEYQWYWAQAGKSKYPMISVIGNHDYLGSGKLIYSRMFGQSSFTFDVGAYHFVVFDDVVWENNNTAPDFDWLNQQTKTTKNNVVFSHIPPWSDQLVNLYQQPFQTILAQNNVMVAIHGHDHDDKDTIINGIPHYVIADMDDRRYGLVSLYNAQYTFQRISY